MLLSLTGPFDKAGAVACRPDGKMDAQVQREVPATEYLACASLTKQDQEQFPPLGTQNKGPAALPLPLASCKYSQEQQLFLFCPLDAAPPEHKFQMIQFTVPSRSDGVSNRHTHAGCKLCLLFHKPHTWTYLNIYPNGR